MSKQLLTDLAQELSEGRVLVLVGAGVSVAAAEGQNAASWSGLLRDGIERAASVGQPRPKGMWKERQFQALDGDLLDWLGVAEQVEARLRKSGEFPRWMHDTVGKLKPVRPAVIERILALRAPVATTNYDSLLEDVGGLESVTFRRGPDAIRFFRGDDRGRAILHLHGHWSDPDTVVLGVRSYHLHIRVRT
jgi:SIR2-like domain